MTWRRRFAATEVGIALLIFCAATWAGVRAVQAFRGSGGVQEFYQSQFGPAVMFACGRGFRNPDTRTVPSLAAFLSTQSDSFTCAELPAAIPTTEVTPFQAASGYLELAVALTWKFTGVSWSGLAILNGVLFGFVAVLTYGVLRLALWRVVALMAMPPALMWAPNLMLVSQLRDYAKGPFLLAVILIMGIVVIDETDRRRARVWSMLAGMLIALGVGFRTDVMIALVPAMLTIGLLLPASVSLRSRMAAIAILLVSFAAVAFPVLKGYAAGGNTGHVILLGLAADFDRTLKVQPATYELVGQYNDTLAFSIINGFAVRIAGRHAGVDLSTTEYDRMAAAYLRHLAETFPADVVTRTLAAIRMVPRYFLESSLEVPMWSQSRVLRAVYWFRGGISARLAVFAVPAVVLATLAIAMTNPRAAWFAVMIIVVFSGGAAIQFHERHFYYLQFLPWLAFGILAQTVMRGRALAGRVPTDRASRLALVCAAIVIASGSAIVLSRAYQQRTARRLFAQYESAHRTRLTVEPRSTGSSRMLLTLPEWTRALPPESGRVTTRFLEVQFLDRQCPRSSVDLTARYEAVYPDADLSETVTIPLHPEAAEPTMRFLAAYDRADESIRFRGIEMPAGLARCIAAVYRVDGLERTPLLLNATLAAGWREERLYQQLR